MEIVCPRGKNQKAVQEGQDLLSTNKSEHTATEYQGVAQHYKHLLIKSFFNNRMRIENEIYSSY